MRKRLLAAGVGLLVWAVLVVPIPLAVAVPVAAVTPPGVDEDTFVEFQQRLFRESLRVAFAVGLERAGEPVGIRGGGVRVLEVLPAGPAAEVLEREDVITELDGEPVELVSDLATRLEAVTSGSGTIGPEGRVGRVDGIPQKVRGAIEADAARSAAEGRLEVIEVDTLDAAVDALEGG